MSIIGKLNFLEFNSLNISAQKLIKHWFRRQLNKRVSSFVSKFQILFVNFIIEFKIFKNQLIDFLTFQVLEKYHVLIEQLASRFIHTALICTLNR